MKLGVSQWIHEYSKLQVSLVIPQSPINVTYNVAYGVLSANGITGPILIMRPQIYTVMLTHILTPFFFKLSNYKRIYAFLHQDSAGTHTTNILCIAYIVFRVSK